MTMLCSVALVIFMSCLLAPSTDTASGTPLPSTRILRFVPDLALSVGFGPVLFFPKRCFCNHAIHSLPFPINPSFFIVHDQSIDPHSLENTSLSPFLESVMYCYLLLS